ncbi:MAG: S-methyl-5-thioribose-1-phosphate isomerase [Chloroflexi bacterium]|nr:S-methyl-5-thioribose-1-phosphate isomerase [Chloroflexota bacterium]MCC6893549.1 S-methyl-5-thioribose-1-phosphate isomerase [Anaerolineae bacterium]
MRTVEWHDGIVRMIDQKALPWKTEMVDLPNYKAVAAAITDMTVRGAPAIGASAAFGMALAAKQSSATSVGEMMQDLGQAADVLKAARPTAVNLAWAVDRLMNFAQVGKYPTADAIREALLNEAQRVADEDVAINKKMGANGAALIKDGDTILHHCNTGALATVDYGTALGVVRAAFEQGKKIHVLLDETRPRLQGARLSAWEMEQLGVSYDILPDTAAGYYMQKGEIKIVLVGADRVAANGDFANKIGTYQVAVLAKENNIPFYTVAPTSTIDLNLATGAEIPIEERGKEEVLTPYGNPLTPEHFKARNPAFDVTPHRYLSGIITENGIARPPFSESLKRVVAGEQV